MPPESDPTSPAPASSASSSEAPADSLAAQWHYAPASQPLGPVSLDVLVTLIQNADVKPTTLVWTPGMSEWAPAGSITALAELFKELDASHRPAGVPTAEQRGDRGDTMRPPTHVRPPMTPGPLAVRSNYATGAMYAGLLAFIPVLGLVASIFAIVLGILALRDISEHPNRHGLGPAWFGTIAGALLLFGYVLMGLALFA
jgi:hypothetical protein